MHQNNDSLLRRLAALLLAAMLLLNLGGCAMPKPEEVRSAAEQLYSEAESFGLELKDRAEALTGYGTEAAPDTAPAAEAQEAADTGNAEAPVTEAPVSTPVPEPTQDELWPETDNGIYYYYYSRLTDEEKSAYRCILGNMQLCSESFTVELYEPQEGESRAAALVQTVLYDHPELFWVSGSLSWQRLSDHETRLILTYEYSAEDIAWRQQQIAEAAEYALWYIQSQEPENTYQTVRAVFEYVIDTVSYELDCPDNQNICSSMLSGVSVCAGYARETLYLLQLLGVDALMVCGNVENGNSHAWNMVCIDDCWYQLDTTYGDRAFETVEDEAILTGGLQYDYSYLCCSDERMYRDRAVYEDDLPVPECPSDGLNAYLLEDRFFWSCGQEIRDAAEAALLDRAASMRVEFADYDSYADFCSLIQDDSWWLPLMEQTGVVSLKTCAILNDQMYAADLALGYD